MKRKVLGIVLALVLVLSCAVTAFAYTVPSSTVVYVTPTGECYHRQSCSYIQNSCRGLTIAAAEADGYRACSRCDPDTKTGKYTSGGNSGNSGGVSGSTVTPTPTPTPTPQKTEPTKSGGLPGWLIFVLGLVVGPFLGGAVFTPIVDAVKWKLDEPKRKEQEERERQAREAKRALEKQARQRAEEAKRQQFEREKAEYTALYGGKSAEEAAGMPDWAEIGPDGLPKEKGVIGYGEIFTRYVSASGKCYHSRWNCCGAMIGVHVTRAKWNGRRPCSKCGGALPDLRWYTEYQKIQRIKKKYGIE